MLDSEVEEPIEKTKTDIKNSLHNPKVVICHNDDYNHFSFVTDCFIRICKMHRQTAEEKTLEVHQQGKSVVAEGDDEHLKKIKLRLRAEGLSVTIETA
jgi:ATP-dependent Clp protease adapter protein ClpS